MAFIPVIPDDTQEAVDRVAKVICDYPKCWDEAPDDGWKEFWRKKARKAIAAFSGPMTHPSPPVVDDGR